MSRGLDASTISAIQSDAFQIATLIRFDFSTVLRLTDWPSNLTFDGGTFVASADLMEVSGAPETAELQVNEFTLTLSGVSKAWVDVALANAHVNVRCRVWKVVISSGVPVGDGIMVFDGRVQNYIINETGDDSKVEFNIASHWKDFERISGRRTNESSQQRFFPSDRGMEFAKDLQRDVPWGRR